MVVAATLPPWIVWVVVRRVGRAKHTKGTIRRKGGREVFYVAT